jgi:hypothetical protein
MITSFFGDKDKKLPTLRRFHPRNGDVLIEFKKEDGTTRIKTTRGKSQIVIRWATL